MITCVPTVRLSRASGTSSVYDNAPANCTAFSSFISRPSVKGRVLDRVLVEIGRAQLARQGPGERAFAHTRRTGEHDEERISHSERHPQQAKNDHDQRRNEDRGQQVCRPNPLDVEQHESDAQDHDAAGCGHLNDPGRRAASPRPAAVPNTPAARLNAPW